MQRLDAVVGNIVGDVLISAACVAYLGPFTVSSHRPVRRYFNALFYSMVVLMLELRLQHILEHTLNTLLFVAGRVPL